MLRQLYTVCRGSVAHQRARIFSHSKGAGGTAEGCACAQRGAPYQYNQEGAFLAQKLHSANSVLRLLAAKAMPFAFSMPAGLATSRTPSPPGTAAPRTLMRDILRAADTTTRNLYIAGAGALAGAVGTGCCVSGMAFEQCVAAGTVAALGMLVCAGLAKQLTVMQQGIGQAKMGV